MLRKIPGIRYSTTMQFSRILMNVLLEYINLLRFISKAQLTFWVGLRFTLGYATVLDGVDIIIITIEIIYEQSLMVNISISHGQFTTVFYVKYGGNLAYKVEGCPLLRGVH